MCESRLSPRTCVWTLLHKQRTHTGWTLHCFIVSTKQCHDGAKVRSYKNQKSAFKSRTSPSSLSQTESIQHPSIQPTPNTPSRRKARSAILPRILTTRRAKAIPVNLADNRISTRAPAFHNLFPLANIAKSVHFLVEQWIGITSQLVLARLLADPLLVFYAA